MRRASHRGAGFEQPREDHGVRDQAGQAGTNEPDALARKSHSINSLFLAIIFLHALLTPAILIAIMMI